MWDDHPANLDMLFKVANEYSNIEAIGYFVKDGKVSRYVSRKEIAEEVISAARRALRNIQYN